MTKRLQRVADECAFVRVIRRGRRLDKLNGVVTSVGRKWMSMTIDYDAGFNGFAVLRVRDVVKVETQSGQAFMRGAWTAEGNWPVPCLEDVDLDRTRDVLRSLGRQFPLLTVHYEHDDPDACMIGTPVAFRRKKFDLVTIDTNAEWDDNPFIFSYREVSRIGVGGGYERRLLNIGGPPPSLQADSSSGGRPTDDDPGVVIPNGLFSCRTRPGSSGPANPAGDPTGRSPKWVRFRAGQPDSWCR